jgi:hypothetical protein
MGLDSFWKMPKGKRQPRFKPGLHLVGGMFSGSGNGSFRGKIYADLIDHVTGVSIYQEEIPNEMVRKMADKLQAFDMSSESWKEWQAYEDQDIQHWHDLVRMFRVYADAGALLHGWW